VDLEAAAAEVEDRAGLHRLLGERLRHGLAHQARLLLALDDLELDAGLVVEAVDQHVAVARVAHRAGRDRAIDADAVMIEALAESHERGDRLIDQLHVELAAGERVVAEADGDALGLDAHELAAGELGDHDADRVRSGVDGSENRAASHEVKLSALSGKGARGLAAPITYLPGGRD